MKPVTDLQNFWEEQTAKKNDMITRCETYAAWTVPSICPQEEDNGAEQTKGNVAIGARLVNHLANRVVDTMFPSDRPFFSLPLTVEAEEQLAKEIGNEDEMADMRRNVKKATAAVENKAMRKLNLTAYRPKAIEAIQHLVVTGNVVIHRLDDETRVVYGVKDFCVKRDIRGLEKQLVLRDMKTFDTLPDAIQEKLTAADKDYTDDSIINLYTYYVKQGSKWLRQQAVDTIMLEDSKRTFNEQEVPFLALTWQLSRAEDYGRGLVEQHAVTFHNVDVTTMAMIDLIGIASDIKWLVNPASMMDIVEWNQAKRGQYLPGKKDDITTPDFPKRLEIQIMQEAIREWQTELAQAFLLNSSGIRDAERVTAEEIRFVARELESAYGGLYSTLSLGWQFKEATYLIAKMDIAVNDKNFEVVVTTGLDSLSREGQLDQLRLAVSDLQMLDGVPEDMRNVMDKRAFAEFVFTNRGIKLADFVMSEEEIRQQQAQEQAALQAQQQQEAATEVGVDAAKQATKEG